jgi:hypothetical protein
LREREDALVDIVVLDGGCEGGWSVGRYDSKETARWTAKDV